MNIMSSLNEFNTSPVAESRWIYINDPVAFSNGEFKSRGVAHSDPGATYSISHVYDLDDPQHAAFIDHIKELEELAFEQAKSERKNKGKSLKFVSSIKELSGEDAGKVLVKFKTKAASASGDPKSIALYDSSNPPRPIKDRPRLGNGSKTSVVFNPIQTQFNSSIYLSLFLIGVQVVELSEFKSGIGFSAQNGGFTSSSEESSSDNLASLIEKSSDNPAY